MTPAGRRVFRAPFAVAAILVALACGTAAAEIYQWVDEQGTVHFTDEISGIPPAQRGKARLLLREAPVTIPAPPATGSYGPAPQDAGPSPGDAESGDPVTLAEQLRAKIAAKEQLIKSVDEKRSIATNPLRNRFVSPTDMELYRKYQAELPGDRERLKELEARIEALTR